MWSPRLQDLPSLALAIALLIAGGCGGASTPNTPAPPSVAFSQPSGSWLVSLHEADGVELDFVMTFETTGNSDPRKWSAYTRPGGARELAGRGVAFLGRLAGRLPREALIHVSGAVAGDRGDTLRLDGLLESPFLGRRDWRGYIADGQMQATLTRTPSGQYAGTMTAVRHMSNAPLRDYLALAAALERAIRTTIFDPRLPDQPQYRRFFQEIHSDFARARDDLDAVASFQAHKPSLNTSHLEFIRNPRVASLPLDSLLAGAASRDTSQLVRLGFPAPDVAFLRVTRWQRVDAAIAAAFVRIDSAAVHFLILDIRANPGGDASSISPLTHLITDTMTVGTFVGRQWFAQHADRPRAEDFARIRTLSTNAEPPDLIRDIREHGAVRGVAVPREPHYAGKVFLLTDRGTGSASEPLAHALKQARLATLIGERTAGVMLTALPQSLGDGWIVVVPEADYAAQDGTRLEGRGVEPHIAVSPNDVFLAVADQMSRVAPFSAEFLRAGSLETLRKLQDAERAYRKALAIVESQQPGLSPQWRAAVHRRLARLLANRGQLAQAAEQWRHVLRHLPNDTEALAALRRDGSGE